MDQELIERARSGNEQAMTDFIALMLVQVTPLAQSFARSSEVPVDDLLQEVGIRMWKFRSRVVAVEKPAAYSKRLARNAMIDQYRRTMRQRGVVSALIHERMVAI